MCEYYALGVCLDQLPEKGYTGILFLGLCLSAQMHNNSSEFILIGARKNIILAPMAPSVLTNFYVAARNLREVMECDLPLDDFERVSLENYIALIQMTYIEWQRRNSPPPLAKKAA